VSTVDRRQVLRLIGGLAAVGLTGAAAACAGAAADPAANVPNGKRIPIGLVAPAVGAYAKIGDEITKGFQLYLQEHAGLLGRYQVDLTVVDETATTSDATKAVKGLFAANVLAVAGVASPAVLAAIVPEAANAKTPVLSANAAPRSIGAAEYVWLVASVQGEAGQAAAAFARQQGTRAYILSDDLGQPEVEGFKSRFSDLGGIVVGNSIGTTGKFSTRLADALETNPDVIFASHNGDAATALLAAYGQRSSPTLVGPGLLTESADMSKLGAVPPHVYTTAFYAPDLPNTDNQRFVASYHNAHGEPPSSSAAAAYDSANLIDRALRLIQGDADPDKLNDALGVLGQINSPRGTWTFNTTHSPQQAWYLRQLRLDGQVASNMLDSDLAVLS
jgi:branched-chain amino acid transport system substrate-binding protein